MYFIKLGISFNNLRTNGLVQFGSSKGLVRLGFQNKRTNAHETYPHAPSEKEENNVAIVRLRLSPQLEEMFSHKSNTILGNLEGHINKSC